MSFSILKKFALIFAAFALTAPVVQAQSYLYGFKSRLSGNRVLIIQGKYRYPSKYKGDIPKTSHSVASQQWKTCTNFARGWNPRGPKNNIRVKGIKYTNVVPYKNRNILGGAFGFQCWVEAY